MPYCCVITCKNHSGKTNLANSGVSYHKFPSDPDVEAQWIRATGRKEWRPQKGSTICSQHFDEDSYLIGGKYRRLPDDAVPNLNIAAEDIESIEVEVKEILPSKLKRSKSPVKLDSENYDEYSRPQLKIALVRSQKLVKKQTLLIKKLRQQNRRDAKKITLQNKVLNDLMEIYNLKPGDIAILKTEIMKAEE